MADIADAVDWANLEPLSGPVLGYADGPVSAWPNEAFTALGARVVGVITVLADERYAIFDSEAGDAGTDAVATAVADRFQARAESTVYSNASNLPGLSQSLRRKGLHWTDAQFWPEPGCYLWAAAPGITPGTVPSWCPVSPVAVQDRWLPGYNLSTTRTNWPATTGPPPPTEGDIPVVYVKVSDGETFAIDGSYRYAVLDPADLASLEAAGAKVVKCSDNQFAHVRNVVPGTL
jgi:hypothetical protein